MAGCGCAEPDRKMRYAANPIAERYTERVDPETDKSWVVYRHTDAADHMQRAAVKQQERILAFKKARNVTAYPGSKVLRPYPSQGR